MATIRPFKKDDPEKGYVLDFIQHGKRARKWFKTEAEANEVLASVKEEPLATDAILKVKGEMLYVLERCKEYGVTIKEVMDFYELHGAKKKDATIEHVVSELLENKRQAGRKDSYLTSIEKHLKKFCDYASPTTNIKNITEDSVNKFVYGEYDRANEITKLNVIRNLSVLFNYAIKKNYLGISPLRNIEKPTPKWNTPSVLSPSDMKVLLDRCYKKGWYDRLTMFVLVGFCGIRTEEASKLSWNDIDLEAGKVMVPADVAKKLRFRRNIIPPNALAWLKTVEDKRRTGPIIGENWVALLRSAVKYAHIGHTKNCLRHSFCSYALEAGWPLAEVVAMLGHSGSPAMIGNHYRNIVEKKDAEAWWKIVPA